jgi:site-specific DNA-adenine methylase
VAGSKGAAGAWQKIVSLLPPHRVFIEAFAGGAALTRNKRASDATLLIERDPATALELGASMRDRATVILGDALAVLRLAELPADVVVYCDPPYVMAARKSQKPCYRFDWNDADHERFLAWVLTARCPVIVSGYWSKLYAAALAGWRHSSFTVGTRRGKATEHVWCNFAEPAALHDAGHVGANYTERQRIRRKAARWVAMLAAMPASERAAVLEAIAAAPGLSRAQTPATMAAALATAKKRA